VVFKRVKAATGEARYMYHGNDGVDVPWNDTAQLDFTRADVREAVSDQILAVAQRFPIIRLDVAMALARQHIRRLWHPQPELGDIGWVESRQHLGRSLEEFEAALPEEFWLEVVERVDAQAPDTLLLAEAFWLMEGYFAHGLGMHRVYNSDFMHAMADERNAEFRQRLKSILAFEPRLLTRQVNFLSTPDEESARNRFGSQDKYFGAATLLATLPGTPMFAHGQVDGLRERYSMDSRQPQVEESPDASLVARHLRQIAPLLRRRELFAGLEHFRIYDVANQAGARMEDVFAFSNRGGGQRALVAFNNSPKACIALITADLVAGLGLDAAAQWEGRELVGDTEFHWDASTLAKSGLRLQLDAYQAQVYWQFEPAA
jgi:glycosidase